MNLLTLNFLALLTMAILFGCESKKQIENFPIYWSYLNDALFKYAKYQYLWCTSDKLGIAAKQLAHQIESNKVETKKGGGITDDQASLLRALMTFSTDVTLDSEERVAYQAFFREIFKQIKRNLYAVVVEGSKYYDAFYNFVYRKDNRQGALYRMLMVIQKNCQLETESEEAEDEIMDDIVVKAEDVTMGDVEPEDVNMDYIVANLKDVTMGEIVDNDKMAIDEPSVVEVDPHRQAELRKIKSLKVAVYKEIDSSNSSEQMIQRIKANFRQYHKEKRDCGEIVDELQHFGLENYFIEFLVHADYDPSATPSAYQRHKSSPNEIDASSHQSRASSQWSTSSIHVQAPSTSSQHSSPPSHQSSPPSHQSSVASEPPRTPSPSFSTSIRYSSTSSHHNKHPH